MTDEKNDISTQRAYINALIEQGELVTGLVAPIFSDNHRMQRLLGRIEGALLVLLVVLGVLYFRLADDMDVLDLRIQQIEALAHE